MCAEHLLILFMITSYALCKMALQNRTKSRRQFTQASLNTHKKSPQKKPLLLKWSSIPLLSFPVRKSHLNHIRLAQDYDFFVLTFISLISRTDGHE